MVLPLRLTLQKAFFIQSFFFFLSSSLKVVWIYLNGACNDESQGSLAKWTGNCGLQLQNSFFFVFFCLFYISKERANPNLMTNFFLLKFGHFPRKEGGGISYCGKYDFLSFITIWVFFMFIKIGFFLFHDILSFYSFITVWVF